MRKKIASIAQKLYPPSICTLCNQFHRTEVALCELCLQSLVPLNFHCQYCANPLPHSESLICGACIRNKPYFDETWVNYSFEEPLRGLIHQFKYHQQLYLAKLLCTLMMMAKPENSSLPECLIPIPMHPSRIKDRGFNQAAILAKMLSKRFAIPWNISHCQKKINTKPQAGLNGKERQTNLKGAFIIQPLPYKHVALIDDLVTTGSTANEMARLLKETGVEKVSVWCCAKA
jgi:ComF family protein